MSFIATHIKSVLVLLLVTVSIVFYVAFIRETYSEDMFVGKWQSSRIETPIYMYDNGEWEIKAESGAVVQYGVWDYEGDKITWSFKWGSVVRDDVDPVVSATETEFKVRESDGTTTTFIKLD